MDTLTMIKTIMEDKTKEFKNRRGYTVKHNNKNGDGELIWKESGRDFLITDASIRFTWEEMDTSVPFAEAVLAHYNRKTIKCIREDAETTIYKSYGRLIDQNNESICSDEILNGKWYIMEGK